MPIPFIIFLVLLGKSSSASLSQSLLLPFTSQVRQWSEQGEPVPGHRNHACISLLRDLHHSEESLWDKSLIAVSLVSPLPCSLLKMRVRSSPVERAQRRTHCIWLLWAFPTHVISSQLFHSLQGPAFARVGLNFAACSQQQTQTRIKCLKTQSLCGNGTSLWNGLLFLIYLQTAYKAVLPRALHEVLEDKFSVNKLTNLPCFLGCSLFSLLWVAIKLTLLSSGFSNDFSAPLVPSSFTYLIFFSLWTSLILPFLPLAIPWWPPLITQPSPSEELLQLCWSLCLPWHEQGPILPFSEANWDTEIL